VSELWILVTPLVSSNISLQDACPKYDNYINIGTVLNAYESVKTLGFHYSRNCIWHYI